MNEFESALGRYGGNLDRWPAAERREAEALIARDADAARLHDDVLRLEALLARAVEPVPVDSAMMGRIVGGVGNGAHADRPVRLTRRLAAIAGAAMAASLVIGFVAGVALPQSDGEDTLAGLMFGASPTTATDTEGVL